MRGREPQGKESVRIVREERGQSGRGREGEELMEL
jgi:hypothetical protein